ncbi:hypothetical protein [Fervidicoccus sp.]|uniref:hypothetical protein n=1 Tax=Fervidicoccus sp. TaxID=2060324 RepID=UPI003D09946E
MEEILFKNIKGIVGVYEKKPTLLRTSEIFIDEQGSLHYEKIKKTGRVIDCKNGVVMQSFFNGGLDLNIYMKNSENIIDNIYFDNSYLLRGESKISKELLELAIRRNIIESLLGAVTGTIHIGLKCSHVIEHSSKFGFKTLCGPIIYGENIIDKNEINNYAYLKNIVLNVYLNKNLKLEHLKNFIENYDNKVTINYRLPNSHLEYLSMLKTTGNTPILSLAKMNLIKGKIIISNVNWITNTEIELMKEKDIFLENSPVMSSYLGIGSVLPIAEFMKDKLTDKIIIGTDYFFEGLFQNLVTNLFIFFILQRFFYSSRAIKWNDVINMLWNGWQLISSEKYCIKDGCEPDLVLIDNINWGDLNFERAIFNSNLFNIKGIYINKKSYLNSRDLDKLRKEKHSIEGELISKMDIY